MLEETEFIEFSAQIGRDRLRIQGAGGNTSIKIGDMMWIKASGTCLADALDRPVFVKVDCAAIRAGLAAGQDDPVRGTYRAGDLRPSIETAFHAALDWPIVAHTHSICTLAHAVSPQGRATLARKLAGLDFVIIPYCKPGIELTRAIMESANARSHVFILNNHGLICCGQSAGETRDLMDDVEARLALPPRAMSGPCPEDPPPSEEYEWRSDLARLALDEPICRMVRAGSCYPDHVVFLGPSLPGWPDGAGRPAILVPGHGVLVRKTASAAQQAMLTCLGDLFAHLPADWEAEPIGTEAEAVLLDWDAEKYRQGMARA